MQRFISRQEILADIGKHTYERAVKSKKITPLKAGTTSNCKVRVDRLQYEQYLKSMELK